MQKYKYVALNMQKEKIHGTFIAKDEKDLAEQLAKQGLYLVSSKSYSGRTPSAFFTTGTGKVKLKEITTFCRQFSIMLNTHVTVLDSIGMLKSQNYSAFFRGILEVIYEDVKSGVVLSAALEKHAKVFPNFFCHMVYVGEQSGKLEAVFEALADYYERDAAIRRKVKSALSYPVMLLVMAFSIFAVMMFLIIPQFRKTLEKLEVENSGWTDAVYGISDFMVANWMYLLAAVIILVLIIFMVLRTEKGSYAFDYMKLKLPILKNIQLSTITARFARSFALLLSSGVDIARSMSAAEIVISNRYVKKRFAIASEKVKQGTSLTAAFEESKIFPPMMNKMIATGEATNALEEVLSRSCVFFDAQVESSLNSATAKIQPIMLVIIGVIVLALFLAVYSPMLAMMSGMSA